MENKEKVKLLNMNTLWLVTKEHTKLISIFILQSNCQVTVGNHLILHLLSNVNCHMSNYYAIY